MISEKEVKHIAKLARLGLTEKEIKKMKNELSSILDYFNLLKEVDTEKIKKIETERTPEGVTREDVAERESLETINKLAKAAPQKEKGYIKVKTVF